MRGIRIGFLGAAATAVALVLAAGPVLAQKKLSMSKIKVAKPFTVLVQHAAFEAALKSGAFKKEGLEVELVQFRSWTEPVQAIAGNAAQFALGGGSFIRAATGRNAPVRAIATISSRMPYLFWAKKSSGIKSLADVKGKTIQTVRTGETLDNVWKQLLGSVKLSMTDVKRVESFNGFGTLMSGQADVANISSNWLGKARGAGLVPIADYNKWLADNKMPTNRGANLAWGTSLKMLKDHPDVVKAYLRALVASTVRLRKDKDFAVSVLTAKPFGIDAKTAGEVYDMHKDHWIMRLDLAKGDFAFDIMMTEIVMKRPKGSIDAKTVTAAGPITDVLKDMKVEF